MALIRWQPIHPARDFVRMQSDLDRLFDGVFQPSALRPRFELETAPAVDIEEDTEGFVLRADLPGVQQKDVKVHLYGDTLTIRGERDLASERNEKGAHRVERYSGVFERTFTLGVPVRADQVKAVFHDGVLEIRVPKADEARTREIEIQVAKS